MRSSPLTLLVGGVSYLAHSVAAGACAVVSICVACVGGILETVFRR